MNLLPFLSFVHIMYPRAISSEVVRHRRVLIQDYRTGPAGLDFVSSSSPFSSVFTLYACGKRVGY